TLDDTDILGIIAKEARQRRESIEAFRLGNRQDLVAQEEAELAVLNEYLPLPMSGEEVKVAARQVIEEVGAQGLSDKGKVMPKLIAQLKGRADGREINAIVTELLTS
ncbi:MAG TPA: GatB/YqeY domain-containing protein, partial [Dehalococcoidales bacterium]|nr:GatB/YqeY domain-containing protein [Dehalococcoidales bacterium]